MNIPSSQDHKASLLQLVREHYCVCGADGREDDSKLQKVLKVLASEGDDRIPDVEGVPRLRGRIEEVEQIPRFVREYLPTVQRDPHLHALSFVDPLLLATDFLGLAISPSVSRVVRRQLRGVVSFDAQSFLKDGRLAGAAMMRWRPKDA